jgi:hypothetical protein
MNPEFVSSYRYIRYIELAKANQDVDVTLYFFTNDGVSFEKKYVIGIYYNHQKIFGRKKNSHCRIYCMTGEGEFPKINACNQKI